MAEATVEKAICEKCGSEVRDNTAFCYNCGHSVSAEAGAETLVLEPEARSALDDLAERMSREEAVPDDEKLARAAAARKKARVGGRRTREFRWEPAYAPIWMILLIAVVLSVIVGGVVLLARYLK